MSFENKRSDLKDGYSRREFFERSAVSIGSWSVALGFAALARNAHASEETADFGPLRPVRDQTTGLELLQLPDGFRYLSFGWRGDEMSDGTITPGNHDGMGVIHSDGSVLTMVRNHENDDGQAPFSKHGTAYDMKAAGGCTNLQFDVSVGQWKKAWTSLVGTARNCAGGITPWGTWLSCEETVSGPGSKTKEGRALRFEQEHGFVFEVPTSSVVSPIPLKAMGRFVHEALAIDPKTGYVYETEDAGTAGFYRFIPSQPGNLGAGGSLSMMRVIGWGDLRKRAPINESLPVEWVGIDDPLRAHTPEAQDGHGVFQQGKDQNGTTFARLEGCWYGNGYVFIVSTSGGPFGSGQIFKFDPQAQTVTCIFESPGSEVLDSPDNITVSPRGGIVLCEDGERTPQRLQGLTTSGHLFELAANNVVLKEGDHPNFKGDFRKNEWCGVTFSPDGRWLFANLQTPGITVAITGPWETFSL